MGNEQTVLVDENYKSKTIPTQISLEWGWINQWYQGTKIGPDIYHLKPLKILNYCPIIGTTYEVKNTEARSLVDLMKPFQVLYNICMNQLYKLLEKEIGNVASVNIRRVPRLRDGDEQDSLDIWEMEARERGIIFDDDSPENTKAPVSNTSLARNIDLTRSNEIQSRYNLAMQLNPSLESGGKQPFQQNRVYDVNGISPSLMAQLSGGSHKILDDKTRIRRLTPTECKRLQTIPDWYDMSVVSETQQYRQLVNGWTVETIKHILSYLDSF
jgi:hypothetical protein